MSKIAAAVVLSGYTHNLPDRFISVSRMGSVDRMWHCLESFIKDKLVSCELASVIIDCRADGRIDKELVHQLGIDRDPLPHHVLGQITHQKSPVHVSLSAEHPENMKFLPNLLPCLLILCHSLFCHHNPQGSHLVM